MSKAKQPSTKALVLQRYEDAQFSERPDLVCVEEPLEIRLGHGPLEERTSKSIAVTMRTPGHDKELALGFLYNEGLVDHISQVVRVEYCTDSDGNPSENILRVELHPDVEVQPEQWERNFYMTSSCGVCGKASLESISTHCEPLRVSNGIVSAEVVMKLPELLRAQQLLFKHTGGIHACGLFESNGVLLALREDVGRHNAMDKLSGHLFSTNTASLEERILTLSGRASFELIQKAARTGIGTVVAVGAPSSLAIECAEEFNITLCGFTSRSRFNVYSHPKRIAG